MNDNEYLQEKVMGECWHVWSTRAGLYVCEKCSKKTVGDRIEIPKSFIYDPPENRDYSDPTNYEALSSKFRKWKEWGHFYFHLVRRQGIFTVQKWEDTELVDRIPLIADYVRSKGVEYWDIRSRDE